MAETHKRGSLIGAGQAVKDLRVSDCGGEVLEYQNTGDIGHEGIV